MPLQDGQYSDKEQKAERNEQVFNYIPHECKIKRDKKRKRPQAGALPMLSCLLTEAMNLYCYKAARVRV